MRGISPEKISKLVARDVRIVEKEARLIFEILPDKRTIEIIENPNPRLNVIAVVGPSWGFERGWSKVLLAEIGISRSRPYHEAQGLNRTPEQSNIPHRNKWFSLTPQQYQLIAPLIFRRLEGITEKRVALWKTGLFSDNKFVIPTTWNYWLRRSKRFIQRDSLIIPPRGTRFTVHLKDELFVRDIYWAELNLNEQLRRYIIGMARLIDLRLSWYAHRKSQRPFHNLKGANEVRERLKNSFLLRHPHLSKEIVRRLKDGEYRPKGRKEKSPYWQVVAEMIDWNGEPIPERKLAYLASCHPILFHPGTRLGEIQVLVTTSLEKKKDHIVFEVFPRDFRKEK